MNLPILAHNAHVSESHVDQGNRRELTFRGPASWRTKLLAMTLAALILASATVLSPGTGEAANGAGDRALLCPAGNLTRVAAAHVGGTTHHDTLGAIKAEAHGPLIAGRHVAWSAKRAG
jgi:hypothetical protein